MDPTSGELPHAGEGGSHEADAPQLNEMRMTMTPSEDQGDAINGQKKAQDSLNDKMNDLGETPAALTTDNSSPRSSSESFRTAQEQASPKRPSEKALGKRKEKISPKKPTPALLPPRGSRRRQSPATTHPNPPVRRHRRTDAMSSSASTPTTRRSSSFLLTQPTSTQSNLPVRRHHRSNAIYPSITIHPNGPQALQSVRTFSALQTSTWNRMRAEQQEQQQRRLPTSSTTTLPRADTTAPTSSTTTNNTNDPTSAQEPASPEYANHVPASNIDWTSPSTRRREYQKIDKARKGVCGFLRRIAPCYFGNGKGRMGFHGEGGDGSEAGGSVRRFRMEIEDEDEESDGGVVKKGRWWKIGGRKGKGKGGE